MIQIPLTPAQFAAKSAEIKAEYGVEITGKTGQVEHKGYTLSYVYDDSTLSLNVLHKPALVPEAMVEHELRSWFAI
jgi:hypothetical protein